MKIQSSSAQYGNPMTMREFLLTPAHMLEETPLLWYTSDSYKYQSRSVAIYRVFIYPPEDIITDLIALRTFGWLYISPYFAWDGCSGPTIQTKTNKRACQVHDALFALFRMGLLPLHWLPQANTALYDYLRKDGTSDFRSRYFHWAVEKFASPHADPKNAKPVHCAP